MRGAWAEESSKENIRAQLNKKVAETITSILSSLADEVEAIKHNTTLSNEEIPYSPLDWERIAAHNVALTEAAQIIRSYIQKS